jgi:hypothetical protein
MGGGGGGGSGGGGGLCVLRLSGAEENGGRHALLAPEIVQNAPRNFCVQIDTLDYHRGKSVQ